MANNKFNNKTRNKIAKNNAQHSPMKSRELIKPNEPDLSMLRKPIETSITGFAQARKIYDTGTEELRAMLSTECDLVYECRVCRNLFRSLANFISHKRVYCKQKFNKGLHAHFNNNIAKDDTLKILELEQEYQDFLKNKDKHKDLNVPIEEKLPFTRDLTMILEKLTRSSAKSDATASDETLVPIRQTVAYQNIPTTSVAAFQNVVKESEKLQQTMRAEVTEIDKLMESENVVLQPDGTCVPNTTDVPMKSSSDSSPEKSPGIPIIQISDDDDDEEKSNLLICKICDLQFSTQKTLKFHMKYKHIENRLVYPCPDCTDTFSTSWSVFRHLFKVHRKTAAQIRRMREAIQAKAFRMNNPPAHYEKRRNNVKVEEQKQTVTEEERMDQENQAWMDNMETDGEIPRCGGCGRRFERRAALAAHTNTCQPRRAAQARMQLNSQRRTEGKPPVKDTPPKEQPPSQGQPKLSLLDKSQTKPEKKIEIQIRRDYNKAPSPSVADVVASRMKNSNLTSNQSSENVKEKDCDDATERKGSHDTATKVSLSKHNNDSNQVFEKTQNIHTVKALNENDTISTEHIENTKTFPISNIEKENIKALKLKVGPFVDYPKLMCKKCSQIFPNPDKLIRHMANHLNWKRFACKLCEHKTFNNEKCMLHVRNVHKLKGNAEFYASTVRALSSTEAECAEDSTALGQEAGEHATTTSRKADSDYESRKPAMRRRLSTQECSAMEPTDDIKSTRKRMRKRRSEDVLPSNISSKKSEDTQSSPPKAKKMPIPLQTVMRVIFGDLNESSKTTENDSQTKCSEENNDEEDEKIHNEDKKKELNRIVCESFASSDSIVRRPIRNRAKPRNKDFEYDMSNLLKLEAVAYKESHTTNLSQKVLLKRKSLLQTEGTDVKAEETSSTSDCTKGALKALSSKAVLCGRAQMRESNTPRRYSAPFLRPTVVTSKSILSNLQPKQVLGTSLPMQPSPPMSMTKKTPPCMSPPMKTYEKLYSVKTTCPISSSNTSKLDSATGTKVADPNIVVDSVSCEDSSLACNNSSDSDNNKHHSINESEKSIALSNNNETVKPIGDTLEHTESSSLLKNIKNTLKGKILVIKPMINRSDITKTVTTMIGTSKYQTIKLCGDSKIIAKRELPIKTNVANVGDKASVNCTLKSVSLAQVPQAVVVSQHHAELDSNKEDSNSIKRPPIITASKSECSNEQSDFVPILPMEDKLE